MTSRAGEPPAEDARYLWLVAGAPTIWVGHFLLSYATAAVWCARVAGRDGTLQPVHTAIVWYTAAALVGIALVGWSGLRRHREGQQSPPHDEDTPEDRSRFLGFATMLLAGLSAVATVYVAMSAFFLQACH